ncbi:outer membrane lipoprotein carrier protein LolA [Antarcticibacterium arcticum]|uniref:Outer membrane lipoprotein carrier protein LolA n=1 Tax=Antarcticibacterium arcticum TaxID=2585771 RepID=A0A5B8YJH0_9FLAO|nr:outer membrane lipoprotein carrier protein LolA [Antarcticibacterium arcticum]QED36987.1 outer membrane lipoprotein carrier protein LolA [Antarcticibacterium arcticum]
MRIIKILIYLFTVVAFSQSPLSNGDLKNFTRGVAIEANNLESLSGDFVQTKYIQLMEESAVSKGKLYYKAPNVLKWEYSAPYNYKILFKENQLFINDDGDKSVTSLRSNKLFEKLVSLISGSINGKLLADRENFDVSFFRQGGKVSAVIISRDPSLKQMFSEIVLIFSEDHRLHSVQLKEEEGDYTQIDFKNIKLNQKIDPAIFEN